MALVLTQIATASPKAGSTLCVNSSAHECIFYFILNRTFVRRAYPLNSVQASL